jgi:hypothetical protein
LGLIIGSSLLAVACALGALLSMRFVWLALVALSGIAAALAYWLVWVSQNGGFDKYPGEVLMNLVGAIVVAGMWVAAVVMGVVVGTLFRTRRER